MNLQTIRTASRQLGVSEHILRRRIAANDIPVLRVGNRLLVDTDTLREYIKEVQGIGIARVSEETGLSESTIRRGIHEGWIPARKIGRDYVLQLDEVMDAIKKRMAGR